VTVDVGSIANLLSAVELANEQAAEICQDRDDLAALLLRMHLRLTRRVPHKDGLGRRIRCWDGADCGDCREDDALMNESTALLARVKDRE
jgi:hypothetical protein